MLTTQEVCEACGLPVTTVNDWVAKGYLRPAARGRGGRGHPHLWSGQQAVGLAFAATAQAVMGCNSRFAARYVTDAEKLSDAALDDWAAGRGPSPWAEEEAAYRGDRGPKLLPGKQELIAQLQPRVERVLALVRERLGQDQSAEGKGGPR